MIAIAPPALVPHLGLKRSIEYGAVVYALGLLCTAFAHSPLKIIASTLLTSVGCICIPALVAFIANQAVPAERGALLGALETLQALPPSPGVGEPEAQTLATFALALAPPLCSTPDLSPSPNLAGALPRHRSLELRPDVRLLDLRRYADATARRRLPRGKRVHAGRARRHPSGLRHVPRGGGQLLLMVARRRAHALLDRISGSWLDRLQRPPSQSSQTSSGDWLHTHESGEAPPGAPRTGVPRVKTIFTERQPK